MKKQAPDPHVITKPFDALISAKETATLLQVSPTYVRQLAAEGWISKADDSKYRLGDVVAGYLKFLKDETRRSSKTASASRVQDNRAREIEMRIAREEKELIPLDVAVYAVDQFVAASVMEFRNIPSRFTRDIALRKKLQVDIDAALSAVADRAAKCSKAFTA